MNQTTKNFIIIALLSSIIIAILWLLWKKFILFKKNKINMSLKGGKNNPGHLVVTNNQWLGKIKPEPGQRFENFDTLEHGIRAWLINLKTLINRNGGKLSIDKMIDILTPADENSEQARKNYKKKIKDFINGDIVTIDNAHLVAKAVFDFEANPDYVKVKDTITPSVIKSIQNKYNIV
jgi:hypothetical protein